MKELNAVELLFEITSTVYVLFNQSASPGASMKSNSGKKLTVAIVSGITVLALVIAAILIGIYIFTDAQKNLIKVNKTCNILKI